MHKIYLSSQLNRDIAVTVATLDYLTNIKDAIKNPKIIGEAFLGKIVEISSVDTLTKLYNRQHMTQTLLSELNRYKRYEIPFSILMIDVDHFKKVNDIYGHQAGDKLLFELSKLFMVDLRELDMCSRFGGEEFLIVLPHT
jgi:PleD family two-component response regulator